MNIKKLHFSFLVTLVVLSVASFSFVTHAQESSGEVITNFSEEVYIHNNATIDVTEEITYDFDNNSRHGIYRDIPVSYKTQLGNASIHLSNIEVTDGAGKPYTFTVSNVGEFKRIKIGDANLFVSGIKMYVIKYRVERAIDYYKDFDELYWNVTGNGWQVPIEKASATIYLPKALAVSDLRIACYEGIIGSKSKCNTNINPATKTIESVSYSSQARLEAGEGLTVAVGFPKKTVTEPTAFERFLQLVKDNGIIVLPLIVFAVMFRLWYKKGRDPKGRGTVVAEYESPDNMTPLEMSALLHESAQNKDISAHIIYLATKGFIKITRTETKVLIFSHTDYILTKLKKIEEVENDIDKKVLQSLFIDDTGSQDVKISSLKNNFYKKIPDIKKVTINSVIARGYYAADPMKVKTKYIVLGVISLFFIGFISGLLSPGGLVVISLIASAIIIVGFGVFMARVTPQGAIVKEQVQGLKSYIHVAEKDRIEFHNAPEKNPALFEKLLPFAVVLGVENQWAKQFESMYTTPPSWYNDPSGGAFNAVLFTHNLQAFSTSATSTFSSSPRGSSGSGGGGFSGGGGGGGGGGSW